MSEKKSTTGPAADEYHEAAARLRRDLQALNYHAGDLEWDRLIEAALRAALAAGAKQERRLLTGKARSHEVRAGHAVTAVLEQLAPDKMEPWLARQFAAVGLEAADAARADQRRRDAAFVRAHHGSFSSEWLCDRLADALERGAGRPEGA
jgi:hypothetical protein